MYNLTCLSHRIAACYAVSRSPLEEYSHLEYEARKHSTVHQASPELSLLLNQPSPAQQGRDSQTSKQAPDIWPVVPKWSSDDLKYCSLEGGPLCHHDQTVSPTQREDRCKRTSGSPHPHNVDTPRRITPLSEFCTLRLKRATVRPAMGR